MVEARFSYNINLLRAMGCGVTLLICFAGCEGNATEIHSPATTRPTTSAPANSIADAITRADNDPSSPGLDYGTGLIGPDTNNNGVRDDVDRYVSSLRVTAQQRQYLMAEAIALSRVLSVDIRDSTAVWAVALEISKVVSCAPSGVESGSVAQFETAIETYIFNTPERARYYADFNNALDGSVLNLNDIQC